jgi:hypothetical protein
VGAKGGPIINLVKMGLTLVEIVLLSINIIIGIREIKAKTR